LAISDRFAPASPPRTLSSPTTSTPVQQTPSAATPQPASPAATSRPELFATSFDATPRSVPTPNGELLPPALSPPTDERLTRSIVDAYQLVYGTTKLPTGPERTEWLNKARQMRDTGKLSANDIKNVIVGKLTEIVEGLDNTRPDTLKGLIENEFKVAYGDGRSPSQADYAKWMPIAQKMADDKMSAFDIKMALRTQIQTVANGMDNTRPDTLKGLIEYEFKVAYGDGRSPSQADYAKWMPIAQKMADDKMSATDIKMALRTQIQTVANGLDRTDNDALKNLIEQEFRFSLGNEWRMPTPREAQAWLKIAQELRDKHEASATAIKHEIRRQLQTSISNR